MYEVYKVFGVDFTPPPPASTAFMILVSAIEWCYYHYHYWDRKF